MNSKDVIDLGTVVLKRDQELNWDFYRKEDEEQITFAKFIYPVLYKNFVKVYQETSFGDFRWGLYSNDGKEILFSDWIDIRIICSELTGEAAYINVKDYRGNWGVCKLDGTFLIKPNELESSKWIKEGSKEYLKLKDKKGNEEIYEFSEGKLIKIN